jgi:hypothetical protein
MAITSCKTDVSAPGQLSLIPGDATMVFEISGTEIFAKSGLDNPDNYTFLSFLKMMDADASKFLESFLKGSKEAGISAEKILIYVSQLPNYGVIMPVLDKTAFENWLKKAEGPEPSDEGDFRYLSISEGFGIAWNDKLAIVSGASSREKLAELFKPKDEGLLAKNSDFQEFVKKKADIRMWIRYGFLIDSYKSLTLFNIDGFLTDNNASELLSQLQEYEKDYENISMHSYLNFDEGKIIGNTSFYPPEEVEKLQKKYPIFKKDFNVGLAKDMPEQSYLAFNLFVNIKEYLKIINKNINSMLSSEYLNDFNTKDKSDELIDFVDSPELKTVVDALDGDILFSIHGFNKGLITYPLVSTSFTVKDESAFNNILTLIPKDFYKKQDDYYAVATEQTFIPVYFAYKDNKVFVTNDLDVIKAFVKGRQGKTFADNPVGKAMADKMIFYINLDFATYPDNIKMLLQNVMGDKYKLFTSVVEIYEGLYFSGDTKYNMEFSLQLKNKNVNSLKQILTNIDKTTSSAWTN